MWLSSFSRIVHQNPKFMLLFNKRYFFLTVFLFLLEVQIALFIHDAFIRPYVGDFLVVILLYCMIRTFLDLTVMQAALSVLLFSYLIEFLQYFQLVHVLGLQDSNLAKIIIGTYFAWGDILAYSLGIMTVLVLEKAIGFRDRRKEQVIK